MKHIYLTTVGWKRILQRCTDYFIDVFALFFIKRDKGKVALPSNPKFIFINLGHLGDTLILSYIFPLIKKRYPDAIIDVLTTSSCVPILRNNPFVRAIRIYDHIRNNRDAISIWKKMYNHYSTLEKVLKEIRAEHYDISIEGRVHYPNGNLVALRGKIKHRIGFGSGGYGGLLTTEVRLPQASPYHLVQAILQELAVIEIHERLENIKPYYSLPLEQNNHTDRSLISHPFILFHPESGAPKKLLIQEFIFDIMRFLLNNTQLHIVLCGVFPETAKIVDEFTASINIARQRVTSLVGKTSVDEFYKYTLYATAAITIDSFAAHLCAIECPTFSFYKNGSGALYFPLTGRRTVVVHNDAASKGLSLCPNIESHYMPLLESDEALQILSLFLSDCTLKRKVN